MLYRGGGGGGHSPPVLSGFFFNPILTAMLKWLIAVFLAVFIIGVLQPRLARALRLGQLPGDVRFRFRGREYGFPFVTTVLLSFVVGVISRWL